MKTPYTKWCANRQTYEKYFKEDCPNTEYEHAVFPDQERIIAIGDLHGDLRLSLDMLTVSRVLSDIETPDNASVERLPGTTFLWRHVLSRDTLVHVDRFERWFKWVGGNTFVVQVGDQIDRCRPNDKKCIDIIKPDDEDSDMYIMQLYDELDLLAQRYGGRVISLVGNHEALNLQKDFRYVSRRGVLDYYFRASGDTDDGVHRSAKSDPRVRIGKKLRAKEFRSTLTRQRIACKRPAMVIVGSLLFVHGGVHLELASRYCIHDVNMVVRRFLLDKVRSGDTVHGAPVDKFVNDETSPLWNRDLSKDIRQSPHDFSSRKKYLKALERAVDCSHLTRVLGKLREQHNVAIDGIVIGHTVQRWNGITSMCNDRLHRVDTGASRAFADWQREEAGSMTAAEAVTFRRARRPNTLEITKTATGYNFRPTADA